MIKILAHGYPSESTLSKRRPIKYQHEKVQMVLEKLCILVLWTKVALALEGLKSNI